MRKCFIPAQRFFVLRSEGSVFDTVKEENTDNDQQAFAVYSQIKLLS